jgi:lysophospholipase L1-like esterase
VTIANAFGHGTPVGQLETTKGRKIRTLRLYVRPLARSTPTVIENTLSYMRVEVRLGSHTGTIVAEGWANPNRPPTDQDTLVAFDLDCDDLPRLTDLYVCVYGDSPFGVRRLDNTSLYSTTTVQYLSTALVKNQTGTPTVNSQLVQTQFCFLVEFLFDGPRVVGESGALFNETTGSRVDTTQYGGDVSTITGWTASFPFSGEFNALDLDLRGVNGYQAGNVRVTLYDGSTLGMVIGDRVYQPGTGGLSAGRLTRHRVFFEKIAKATTGVVVIRIRCDRRTGFRMLPVNLYPAGTTPTGATTAYITSQFATSTSLDHNSWSNVSASTSQFCPYVRLIREDPTFYDPGSPATLKAGVWSAVREQIAPTILMPSQIYAVEGVQTWVYPDNVCYSPLARDLADYEFAGTKGRQDAVGWNYTPSSSDAGSTTLDLTAYVAGVQVATKQAALITKALSAGNGVSRKVLVIGDSTSDAGTSTTTALGMKWLAEFARLSAIDTATDWAFVGSQEATGPDSTGTSRTVRHEGYSGRDVNWHYTNASSPFVFSGAFNFATYLSTNSITMASGDWVLIHLGINDVFAATTDDAALLTILTAHTQLDAIIANVKAAVSGVRIAFLATIPPAISQDAFGDDYSSNQSLWRYSRNRCLWVRELLAKYDTATQRAANVFVFPSWIDRTNNFPTTSTTYNSRNSTTYSKQDNGVHPTTYGYWQMADAVYCGLKGNES